MENNTKNDKKYINIKIGRSQLILSLIIIIILPIIIGIFITWPSWLFGYTSANSNSWLGFWGSFLGGIIGTVGVIYVAYLQNAEQSRLNQLQINEMKSENKKSLQFEKDKLYRESLMLFLNQLHEYDNKFINFRNYNSNLYIQYTNSNDSLTKYHNRDKIFFNLTKMEEYKDDLDELLNKMNNTYLILKDDSHEELKKLTLDLDKTMHSVNINELWGENYFDNLKQKFDYSLDYLHEELLYSITEQEKLTAQKIRILLN
ncbi:hypothetical protein [Staphylococcus xylosus]|uniref:hypothetical protein n=1 Tax=Staphylococcus xylosus TaxID=1288 RepID=UPI002DB79D4A|nr:hypothetical protein [Staphylococcus xylosus]MEB8102224.1 hypothetical protein [Staphylococcus xylosus]